MGQYSIVIKKISAIRTALFGQPATAAGWQLAFKIKTEILCLS